ncbi:recombinase family protein [Rufibacter hautae]|uniref:Recombinase family protein n=1 Tax=Rufibacter hautae TaxID=2595005 RepID=A0A5B6TA98_9BACT|nr:recombinase family protein [Rufibacter hautae]KAA3435924.1 recombinase family protein [Rufibacter hautae]
MKIGYARVSTQDQRLELQTDDLTRYGCGQIFKEKISGRNTDRPELTKMLEQLRPGDTVVVWKLDRLGRSLIDLVNLIEEFKKRGVDFVSLQDGIDTSTPNGRLVFHFIAGLAEFERELIRQRTRAGLAAAKARGRVGGRPAGLSKEALEKAKSAKILFDAGGKSVGEIAQILGIGRATCYRYLNQVKEGKG